MTEIEAEELQEQITALMLTPLSEEERARDKAQWTFQSELHHLILKHCPEHITPFQACVVLRRVTDNLKGGLLK